MSYYKRRKIKEGLKYLEDKGFDNTALVNVDKMAEQYETGEIPTKRQMEQVVNELEDKKSIPYSNPSFKEFQKFQKEGVQLPKQINQKTEQFKRKQQYLSNRIDEVRILLQEEGFYKTENFEPSNINIIPTNRQIYKMIDEIKEMETTTQLPLFMRDLENQGVQIPSDMRVKLSTGLLQQEGDYGDLYKEATMGSVDNLEDYFNKAEDNPSEVEINGNILSVDSMRREILQYMESKQKDVPRGNRFLDEYYSYMDRVSSMTNNQIIALFGMYDTGVFLNDLTHYDSVGDGLNTHGMLSLQNDMITALLF